MSIAPQVQVQSLAERAVFINSPSPPTPIPPLYTSQGSFSNVLPTSQVGYHANKPIESVVYCFYKITLSKTMSLMAQ